MAAPRAFGSTPVADTGLRTVSVYFLRDDVVAAARREVAMAPGDDDQAVAIAALSELFAGPSAAEREAGLTTDIPDDAEVRALTIDDRVATVDLSSAFIAAHDNAGLPARLAQVVYTLTMLEAIAQVRLQIEGGFPPVEVGGIDTTGPLNRADFEAQTPPILVESPTVGETVTSPLRVWGTSNTFEGTFQLKVVKIVNGEDMTLTEMLVQTTGSGTRGEFDVTVDFPVEAPAPGKLVVFQIAPSATGDIFDVTEIPLELDA